MTFILSHANALRRYQPVFAGAHRVEKGLPLPEGRVVTANRGGVTGRVQELLFRRFGRAAGLSRGLSRFSPALIHAHFGPSGPAALALAEALAIPLILTFHGSDATISTEQARQTWRGREYLRGSRRVMQSAGLIIAVSDFIRSRLLEKGYPESKVVTHRNGIDVSYFRASGQEREPVVAFVGRFVEKKGCEYLLRALGQLRVQGHPVRGVFIGDGPLRRDLERLAGQLGVEVQFTGFLPLAEVRDRVARASALVVASVTAANGDSEGLPTVILEAQALGTPVIATRHAGNAEGIAEGRSGLLVDERDVPALADAIRFFADNPRAVASFGAAGRSLVESKFNIDTQVEGLERLYDRVLREKSMSVLGSAP